MSDFIGGFLIVASILAWITHVVVAIQAQAYLLLLVGAIFFPIGVVHGFLVWFGLV